MNSRASSLASKKMVQVKTRKAPPAKRSLHAQRPAGSLRDNILFLQRTAGNRTVERMLSSGLIQTKLTIGKPGDRYEREADNVADRVMRMPDPGVQRKPT